VAVDPRSGDVYVLGTFEGQVDFGSRPGKVGFASAGGRDAFVARYTPTGQLVWARRFGGLGPDGLEGVAVDAKGAVYVVGYFHGAAAFCPEAGGEHLATKPGGQAALVAKLDSAGRVLWARHVVGGAGENRAYGIALDGRDGVYVTGRFSGRADFGPGRGALELESRGEADLFVWKLTQAGHPIWVRRSVPFPEMTVSLKV
jgi:hypothetical protein